MKKAIVTLATASMLGVSALGQGYLNLNFESAQNLPLDPPFPNGVLVSATNALPGWTAYGGPNGLSDINYVSNDISGSQTPVELEGGSLALSGDFSVGLYSDSSISQTGLVPSGSESLEFEAEGAGANGTLGASGFFVTLGGQTLSYSTLSEGPDYYVYGANIPTDFDGQMEALIFGCAGVGSGQVLLDNIEFSATSVPEPYELALIGLGAILSWLWRCCKVQVRRQL